MVSVRESVIAALMSTLDDVAFPNVPGTVTLYRARRKAVPEAQLPALVLRAELESSEQLSACHTRHIDSVTITAMVKAVGDLELDQALIDAGAAIMAAVGADVTLGGLAVDVTMTGAGQSVADDEGIGGVGTAWVSYAVEYWTRSGNPYAPAL
jgi:hypothetical protein